MLLLAQMLLWCAWNAGMACVSGLGVVQALVCLSVWTMVMYAAKMCHMVPKMPLNIAEECL
jgi:hypothetical protein